jgi:glycosidase
MDNSSAKGNDGFRRSDFPGGWNGDASDAVSGRGLTAEQQEMKQYMKQLLNWRKNNPVIWNGQLKHFAPFDGIYVYFRFDPDQTVMVVLNKNNREKELDMKRFAEATRGKTLATDVISGSRTALSGLKVPPRSALVFRLQ